MRTGAFQGIGTRVAAAAIALCAVVALLLPAPAGATKPVEVKGIRVWASPASTRVVFDLTATVRHRLSSAQSPDRVVVDVPNARIDPTAVRFPEAQGAMKGFRVSPRSGGGLRIVFDVEPGTTPAAFLADPNSRYGWRLVVDLKHSAASMAATAKADAVARAEEAPKAAARLLPPPRDLVIAVDAGHGGVDPGATGKGGTREKDVTLAIARTLAARIDAEPGMRAVLTRDGDYFVELRERIRRARAANADLFVSIHADAVADRDVAGSSVYILSQRGATNEAARRLAERENAADLVGGVKLSNKDPLLASVLLDLSQSAAMAASQVAAEKVLAELNDVGQVRKARVQQAGFVVLKSPDIPSMLIETAYITNPGEERRLRDPAHQRRLADAILTGVRGYFRENPVPGTQVAAMVAATRGEPAGAPGRALNR